MLDNIIYFIIIYSYTIIGILFLLKIILFILYRTKNWSLFEFFYFNQVNIKYTASVERARVKRFQNILTFLIVFILILKLAASKIVDR